MKAWRRVEFHHTASYRHFPFPPWNRLNIQHGYGWRNYMCQICDVCFQLAVLGRWSSLFL